jgi:hypothetical protein
MQVFRSSSTNTFTLGQAILISRNATSLGQCSLRPVYDHSCSSASASACSSTIGSSALSTKSKWGHGTSWRSYSSLAQPQPLTQNQNQSQPEPGAAPTPAAQSSGLGDAKRQAAFDRLRPVIDSFEGPVDWAVAYGSGVIHQANRVPSGEVSNTWSHDHTTVRLSSNLLRTYSEKGWSDDQHTMTLVLIHRLLLPTLCSPRPRLSNSTE